MKNSSLLFLVSILTLSGATIADEMDAWQVIEAGRSGELTVRFRVKRAASLADKDWIAIEFDNQGDEDIELESASYRFTSTRRDRIGPRVSSLF